MRPDVEPPRDSGTIDSPLARELDQRATTGLTRQRRLAASPCGRRISVQGRGMLNFASNDYLGLANHPEILAAGIEGMRRWGAGSGASHLISGHFAPHEALETAIAAFTGFPRALLFSTGYLANLAVAPTLAGRGAAIFSDKLNHASLIDAVLLAKAGGATSRRYPHGDLAALEAQLAASPAPEKLIITDAVFSMEGDLAPLPGLFDLAERFNAWLLVDDAHGFGVLGPEGEGSLAHWGLKAHPRIILMGTLGKAAGTAGAFVAASEILIETLLQRARSYIFTTAAPPAIACATLKSLEIIRSGGARRRHLAALAARLAEQIGGLPWRLLPSPTAIQPMWIGDNETALLLARQLWERGLWVPAIRPPTVPQGTARLRISLCAAHRMEDVDRLAQALHWEGRRVKASLGSE